MTYSMDARVELLKRYASVVTLMVRRVPDAGNNQNRIVHTDFHCDRAHTSHYEVCRLPDGDRHTHTHTLFHWQSTKSLRLSGVN